ncbi:MAG TPA: MFS transporter [Longimicrobiaceae bacterium]|nr:MFS transporter [Longimicrobiaceae bacterium]
MTGPAGAPLRGRLYYGWVLVGALALTETVSYGVLTYAFPVVLTPMQAELGWPQATLTGAFSLAALAAGVCAVPVGRWVDRYGPRAVMTLGSAGAALLVAAWSRVEDPAALYAVWLGLGACMAAVLYEPAFAVVAAWFRRHRGRALTAVTLAAGLASTIFVPLTTWLVVERGWRSAVLWLAVLLAVLTVAPHAVLLRRRPADLGLEVDGAPPPETPGAAPAPEPWVPARAAVRSRSFRWLTAAFFLSTLANFAVTVHLVPLLLQRGHGLGLAGAAMAALGLAKLPGRLLLTPLAERWTTPVATIAVFGVQLVGLLALAGLPGSAGVWVFAVLFGAGDGASTPARAGIVADLFGPREYGRISGVLALFLALARAAAPVGASLARSAGGGYGAVLWLLGGALAAAGLAMRRADRGAEALRPFRGRHVYLYEGDDTLHSQETEMTTQTQTPSRDLLEETRRILTGSVQPQAAGTASTCCSTAKQEVCCEPSEKSSCCGPEATSGGGCGCQ